MTVQTRINLSNIVGGGYRDFWGSRHRYRVLKGGRGSKKSTTASLWFIYNLQKYYHQYGLKPSLLVIRRYFCDHKDSTYAQLKWAIARLGTSHLWKEKLSPLELVYKPSGQKIIFRGMDKPQSITSLTQSDGNFCWVWWEEAFQVESEDGFDKVDMSIRGDLEAPLFKQHTLTMNPWSDKHWIKTRFFDEQSNNILAQTRNYDCNEFLGNDDIELFEDMKRRNPRRYLIEGNGEWGISEGQIFENWEIKEFEIPQLNAVYRGNVKRSMLFGLDFGYSNDPTAFIALLVDETTHEIFVCKEFYKLKMKNTEIANEIKYLGLERAVIKADSSDPKSIDNLRDLGLINVYGAKKGQGSVLAGINKIQDYKIYVHPSCYNTIVELSNYVWSKEKISNRLMNEPVDDYNHLMDAMRYAMEDVGHVSVRWPK